MQKAMTPCAERWSRCRSPLVPTTGSCAWRAPLQILLTARISSASISWKPSTTAAMPLFENQPQSHRGTEKKEKRGELMDYIQNIATEGGTDLLTSKIIGA